MRDARLALPAGPLPFFDLDVVPFDAEPFARWTERTVAELDVEDGPLERLHERVAPDDVPALVQHLTERSLCAEVRAHLGRALRRALPRLPWGRLRVQSVLQFRVHLPGDARAPAPPHTDYGIGHMRVERNLWVPLTDVEGSSALHVLPLRGSLPVDAARAARGARYLDDVTLDLRPRPMRVGEALVFTPLHVHAGRTNRTERTRVSFDLRFLPVAYAAGYRWARI